MKFGVVVGVCTDRDEHQRRSLQSIVDFSSSDTELICIFNGVEPFDIDPRYEIIHVPELIGKEQGLWGKAFDIAVERGWDWCANFHDDFFLLESGWEDWLYRINHTHFIAMASFATYKTITPVFPLSGDYSYESGNNDAPGFLGVTIDGCGMAFNMELFHQRSMFTSLDVACGYGETEACLWALEKGWASACIPLRSDHHPEGTNNSREVLHVGADGVHEAISSHLSVLPASVINENQIRVNDKIINVRRPIRVLRPYGGKEEINALKEVIESGWWGKGPKVAEFEKRFAAMVGAKYAVALTSNTHGLDLLLKANGIKGCDVISPTISFMSTGVVALWNDCTSTLCDVDRSTLCIDPDDVRKHLKPNTKAVIAVNMAGVPANIDAIRSFYDGLIIEDCAHSCYTAGAGKKGDAAVWSFQAVKTLPCGDGGMITTNDADLYEKIRAMVWLGIKESTFDRTTSVAQPGYVWDYEVDT